MKCVLNNCNNQEEEFHHVIPKSIGGTDKDGRVYLCKKHHDILHKMLIKRIYGFVPINKRDEMKNALINYTDWFVNNFK